MRDKPLFISSIISTILYALFLIAIFSPLKGVFLPFVTTLMLVYLLLPAVKFLEKLGIKNTLATFLVYLIIISLVFFALMYAIPKIYTALIKIGDLITENITPAIRDKIQGNFFTGAVGNVYTTVVSATKGVVNTVVSFVAAFYILSDIKGVKAAFKEFVPEKLKASFRIIADDVKSSFDSFFKGQLLIAAILFLLDAVFLYVMKIPYSIGLAFIAAVLDIIPYAGAIIAMGIIVLVTLLSAPGRVLAVIAGLLVIQQIENNIITPKISSDTLELHPAVTVLALYVGAFGGFWGILLAIPLVSVFKRLAFRLVQSIL